jgi:hypothetical protein
LYSTYVKAVLKIKITTRVANRETRSVLSILTILTELLRLARQFVRSLRLLLLLLLLLHIAIEFSLGGSSFYTSTEKTNKNKYNIKNKAEKKQTDRIHNMKERMSFLSALLPGIFHRQCRFHLITPTVIVQYCLH